MDVAQHPIKINLYIDEDQKMSRLLVVKVGQIHEQTYLLPPKDAANVVWNLMWEQQSRVPPFFCNDRVQLRKFLRLVNAAPIEAAEFWGLSSLPDGGVILGKHNTIEWAEAIQFGL